MQEINFISAEAIKIHQSFTGIFYALVLGLLTLSVVLEYFKWPLGGVPQFGPLVGRVFIATLLLHLYPEISNTLSDLSEGVSKNLGDFNQFNFILQKISRLTETYTFSWVSFRQHLILWLCYLAYFVLYFTIHVAQAFHLYALVLLYVFSPVILAFFVLPAASGATSALFRSLIELSLWKPAWSVLATLLWSTGTSAIQANGSQVSFLSAICFCLIAAGSVVLAPIVVHMLAGSGVQQMGRSLASIGVEGVGLITPGGVIRKGASLGKKAFNAPIKVSDRLTKRRFPKLNQKLKRIPVFRTPKRPSVFVRRRNQNKKVKKGKI